MHSAEATTTSGNLLKRRFRKLETAAHSPTSISDLVSTPHALNENTQSCDQIAENVIFSKA